jgi:CcmD family protein
LNELLGRSIGDRIAADFVVMAVALLVWGALFAYVLRLDRKTKRMERE